MDYRPDIDGLRALAVGAVVLGHAGVPGFSGGYVGVDVFFVISGFLITSILVRELREERFSLVAFYERRVRRLFPALAVVLAASYVAATLLYSEVSRADFGRSVLATLGVVSNLHFWQTSGYFDPGASTKTLLHTWSLAVEEQFYLLFPLLLWTVVRGSTRTLLVTVLVVGTGSFALSVLGLKHFPTLNFYGAPTRAWELMAGSVLALQVLPPFRRAVAARVTSALGMSLIVAAVVLYDEATPFPGPSALVPVIGTALVIHGGRVSRDGHDEPCGGLLYAANTSRAWVGLGLISYSLYLWHWPLLVFFEYETGRPPAGSETVGLVVVSVALAWLSWRFVEAPFRKKSGRFDRRQIFVGAFTVAALLAGLASRDVFHDPKRISTELFSSPEITDDPEREARRLEAYKFERGSRRERSLSEPNLELPLDHRSLFGAPAEPGYALWGDSHANALAAGLDSWFEDRGESLALHAYGSNPPVVGMFRNEGANSRAWGPAKLQQLTANECIHTVILHARWNHFVFGFFGRPGQPSSKEKEKGFTMLDDSGAPLAWGPEGAGAHLVERLQFTIDTLKRAGKRVVLVYSVPENRVWVPRVLAEHARSGQSASTFESSAEFFLARSAWLHERFDALDLGPKGVRIRPRERLLDGERIRVYENERVLYIDTNHLTLSGVRLLHPFFEAGLGSPRAATCSRGD